MAGAGKKTFTAGETLTASDVNTYLMEQSVMYFAGTAARSSAIPTPSTGMTTYIGVTGTATIPQLETYTGSAWQTPYGATLVANASFTAASTVSLSNVFSSAFNNYKIIINLAQTADAQTDMFFRLRTSAGDDSTAFYTRSILSFDVGLGTAAAAATGGAYGDTKGLLTTSYYLGGVLQLPLDLMGINTTSKHLNGVIQGGSAATSRFGLTYNVMTGNGAGTHTGISFFPSVTNSYTGNIKIYGYRNA